MAFGYPTTIRMVLSNNRRFQRLATEELERRALGPFRPDLERPAGVAGTDRIRGNTRQFRCSLT